MPITSDQNIHIRLGGPATGRAVLGAHHAGLAEAVPYLDEHHLVGIPDGRASE